MADILVANGAVENSVSSTVVLGDSKTSIKIEKSLTLTIGFKRSNGVLISATCDFHVLSTGYDVIMGLESITEHFIVVLLDALLAGKSDETKTKIFDFFLIENTDLLEPFQVSRDILAPEESDIEFPIQCDFSYALNFIGLSEKENYDKYLEDFIPALDENILKNHPKFIDLMKTKGFRVFVPSNWDGVKGIDPIELDWNEELVEKVLEPDRRFINPKIYEAAKKETFRLLGYFYEKSTSTICSPIVVAGKATPPYVRICGDYGKLNKWLNKHYGYIPNVQHALEKISGFSLFADLDMTNSFHQFLLALLTRQRLSVQTPWGQFQPKFLPEGVSPASIILQDAVREIFQDFDPWMIYIFDNLLILAHDYGDLYAKLDKVFDRCIERNLFLKITKSSIGKPEIKFFGYKCTKDNWSIDNSRKEAITNIPFPKTIKEARSFLGCGVFFQPFIRNYAEVAAPLYDLTKESFNWNRELWKIDYETEFSRLKEAMSTSVELFFPDYRLEWILRTDASDVAWGAALYQLHESEEGNSTLQPLGFISKKFSDVARRWDTIKKECYAIYGSVKHFQYYLRAKFFIIETDHRNLQWMEKSEAAIIQRMVIFLQGFSFKIRHIPGKLNVVADYLSRLNLLASLLYRNDVTIDTELITAGSYYLNIQDLNQQCSEEYGLSLQFMLEIATSYQETLGELYLVDTDEINELISKVHNGRVGHKGIRRTYLALNKLFPGHGIPIRIIQEYIEKCAICQKDRLRITDKLDEIYRTIKPMHHRAAVGIDNVSLTPTDKNGNNGATVIYNLFTKLVGVYPYPTISSKHLVNSCIKYISSYGLFDEIHSDPGSDLTSNDVKDLVKLIGGNHVISLVDRHESNGVEKVIGELSRHLRALCMEERVIDRWSDDDILPVIQFILNSSPNSENGDITENVSPFDLTFGNMDKPYFNIKDPSFDMKSKHIKSLSENLKILRETSFNFQKQLIKERETDVIQNQLQLGDFVLKKHTGIFKIGKLNPKYIGPFIVENQYKNDVSIRHLANDHVETVHVSKLKLFYGSEISAKELALRDYDQYWLDSIITYSGDPEKRSTLQFKIKYQDNDISWVPYCPDIYNTKQFDEFCTINPELRILFISADAANKHIAQMNKSAIINFNVGDTIYYKLSSLGYDWYNELNLPNNDDITYLVEGVIVKKISTKLFTIHSAIFDKNKKKYLFDAGAYWFYAYGHFKLSDISNNPKFHIITPDFVKTYPAIAL
jgi:hypothetical protein